MSESLCALYRSVEFFRLKFIHPIWHRACKKAWYYIYLLKVLFMKTLTLIVALALSYVTPRAQMGTRVRSRSATTIRTTQTRTVPGTYRSAYRTRVTTTRIFPQESRSYQSNRFNYRTRDLDRNQRIETIRMRRGMGHAYGLRRHRFARIVRER